MSVLRFPAPERGGGIVHVMPACGGGFEVAHESSGGSSWGGFEQFRGAEEAISTAYGLARDQYGGCAVSVCDEALAAVRVGVHWGDF